MTEESLEPDNEGTGQEPVDQSVSEVDRLRSEIEGLQQQLERISAQSEERLRNWQRAQADLINYRRRVEQERSEQVKYSNERLIGRVLPVIDDFERAFAVLPRELLMFTWIDGIGLIHAKLLATLQQEGLRPMQSLGEKFDPQKHEAVMVEEGTDPFAGRVTAELQRGYYLNERVLRPALVKVGPAQDTEAAKREAPQQSQEQSAEDRQGTEQP